MNRHPGFLNNLQNQIESLHPDIISRVSRQGGLEIQELISLILKPKDYTVDCPDPVEESELIQYSSLAGNDEFCSAGKKLVEEDQVSLCILAGGAGTRAGGPKCLMKISDTETLLSRKLRMSSDIRNIWIIVTRDLVDPVIEHLRSLNLLREGIRVIEQFESLRLTSNNELFLFEEKPSLYPCGHGDVVPALIQSGVLNEFLEKKGKYFYVMNVDNVTADVDYSILGYHHANRGPVTCEVVKKNLKDSGGFLCKHRGIKQIVEGFRMSSETDFQQLELINTNTMVVNADLNFETINWSWHRVKKEIHGNLVVQYERLLQQLTEHFRAQFVEVPREKRFMPIKSASDLDKIRLA